ncbi:MAG: 50S ribosomal protein L27 [Parcubacteria group bacterium Gr01-1014_33]|nr:MAG: 50S ribosomal protein L27 [Parcubacteria group bacterium Gr01-1014_33]
MAHTKSAGSTKYGRDSQPKYLGVKKFDGEIVKPGDILIRQRGARFFPGRGVKRGGDDTLYAISAGSVKFTTHRKTRFDGSRRFAKVINVLAA